MEFQSTWRGEVGAGSGQILDQLGLPRAVMRDKLRVGLRRTSVSREVFGKAQVKRGLRTQKRNLIRFQSTEKHANGETKSPDLLELFKSKRVETRAAKRPRRRRTC